MALRFTAPVGERFMRNAYMGVWIETPGYWWTDDKRLVRYEDRGNQGCSNVIGYRTPRSVRGFRRLMRQIARNQPELRGIELCLRSRWEGGCDVYGTIGKPA